MKHTRIPPLNLGIFSPPILRFFCFSTQVVVVDQAFEYLIVCVDGQWAICLRLRRLRLLAHSLAAAIRVPVLDRRLLLIRGLRYGPIRLGNEEQVIGGLGGCGDLRALRLIFGGRCQQVLIELF